MPLAPPTPPLWQSGTAPQPADFNAHIRDDLTFLTKKIVFRAWQNTAGQSIPNTTNTILTLDTVVEDTYSGWTSGASNKYTVQQPGLYMVTIGFAATGGSGAGHMAAVFANFTNSIQICGQQAPISSTTNWMVQGTIPLLGTPVFSDTFTPMAWQNSGAAISTVSSGIQLASFMEIMWVSE